MEWYEDDVKEVEQILQASPYKPQTIFYGSSTIRLWDSLYTDFEAYKPVNLGFGGSTLAACAWFFDRIMASIKNPSTFILYAGDNDLGDERHPEEVLLFFQQLASRTRYRFKNVNCYYVSIKPSISRWNIKDNIIKTNRLIEEEINNHQPHFTFVNLFYSMLNKNGRPVKRYYADDGLHLSPAGYEVWKKIILEECLLRP